MGRTIFITGTDTGVGKTILTGLLVAHATEAENVGAGPVRALKPFSSGERTDGTLLWELQGRREPLEAINPHHFTEPVSPWTAARKAGKAIEFDAFTSWLTDAGSRPGLLLVEGAGGLLAPLGERFTAADVIERTGCEVIVVAANRLGVLNHSLLTLEVLARRGVDRVKVAMMETKPGSGTNAGQDESQGTNLEDLRAWTTARVLSIPYLDGCRPEADWIRRAARGLSSPLNDLLAASDAGAVAGAGTPNG